MDKLRNIIKSRNFILLLISTATIVFMGYHFGTFDQAIHIPFLKKFSNPVLYPGDGFFDLRLKHYSFFWFLFIPFYRFHLLEISMFITYVIAIYLTFLSLWRLSQTLFNNNLISLLCCIGFIFPHIGFAGFPLIEFSLLNRTFVLPFLILGLDLYLKKKYYQSMLLLGLMYNLHVISVNFILFMIGFDLLWQIKKLGFKKLITMLTVFIIAAAPVLIWKLSSKDVGIGLDRQWFELINLGMLHNIFTLIALNPLILAMTISGISSIILFFYSIRDKKLEEYDSSIKNFIIAGIIIVFIVFITSNLKIYPSTLIIQSQIIRIGIFILLFSYLYGIRRVVNDYQNNNITRSKFVSVLSGVFFSITPAIFLFFIFIYKKINARTLSFLAILNIVIFVIIMSAGLYLHIWYPGIHIYPHQDKQYEIEKWISENTPTTSAIIVPPYTWWFYNSEWRVFSERPILVTHSDLLEVAFSPEYVKWWQPRFEAIAPGAIKQFNGDIFNNIAITKKAFYSLKSEDFKNVAKRYNISYLIAEKPYDYNFPIVFQNDKYTVFQIMY